MMDFPKMAASIGAGLVELNAHLQRIEVFTAATLIVAVDAADARGEPPGLGLKETYEAAQGVVLTAATEATGGD